MCGRRSLENHLERCDFPLRPRSQVGQSPLTRAAVDGLGPPVSPAPQACPCLWTSCSPGPTVPGPPEPLGAGGVGKGALSCCLPLVEGESRRAQLEGAPRTLRSWGPSRTLVATSSRLRRCPGWEPRDVLSGEGAVDDLHPQDRRGVFTAGGVGRQGQRWRQDLGPLVPGPSACPGPSPRSAHPHPPQGSAPP